MEVKKGEKIVEIETGNILEVENEYMEGTSIKPSNVFDFLATYERVAGVSGSGEVMHANRGFRLRDEGIVWKRH